MADTPELLSALQRMSDEDRAAWIEQLRVGAHNLVNAAEALQGLHPETKPDPTSWAALWFSVGQMQLGWVAGRLEQARAL